MRSIHVILVSITLMAVVVVVGCSAAPDVTTDSTSDSTETMATSVNIQCPIMGGKVTDEGGRVDYNGQTVGFCCPECIGEWNDLSEEEKSSKLAEAKESSADHDDASHGDHDAELN